MTLGDVMDDILTDGERSADDERFRFPLGGRVRITPEMSDAIANMWTSVNGFDPRGHVGKVLSRRNAYPPPAFVGYWLPLYFVDGVGEVGETMLEAA